MKKLAFIVIAALAMAFAACDSQSRTQKDYEDLERKQEALTKAWGQVELVYQRRADVVLGLCMFLKNNTQYEIESLNAVMEAGNKAFKTREDIERFDEYDLVKFESAQRDLSNSINRLLIAVENCPDLKADDSYLTYQAQLTGCENSILAERERFNEVAKAYNRIARKLDSKECPCFDEY